jgi:hypothetical protein
MTEIDMGALDVREKLAHIDQMLADHERMRINAGHDHKQQEYAPWALIFTGMASAAAFFAAGVAFIKIFGS